MNLSIIKNNQQTIVLLAGYVLVAAISFGIGRITTISPTPPDIRIEEVFSAPLNNTENNMKAQSNPDEEAHAQTLSSFAPVEGECMGKIKGNISSSGRIYHVPTGAFYQRTAPEICFETEASAIEAGFRKSSK